MSHVTASRSVRLCGAAIVVVLSGVIEAAAGQAAPAQASPPQVKPAVHHDTSKLLTLLPQIPPRAVGAVLRRKILPNRIGSQQWNEHRCAEALTRPRIGR